MPCRQAAARPKAFPREDGHRPESGRPSPRNRRKTTPRAGSDGNRPHFPPYLKGPDSTLRQRQPNGELRPPPFLALDGDRAVVGLDDRFGDVETEAEAA